jgi:site-specific recombinase XerD
MRLSALFEEFCGFLRVEKEAAPRTIETYRRCFGDFMNFARTKLGAAVLVKDFTSELCRAYQYDMSSRQLSPGTIRVRLATLGSLGKWACRHDRIEKNPLDKITRPRKRTRLPAVPRWDAVEQFIAQCSSLREKALLALMTYGGLRRSEIAGLDVGDFVRDFGLRRVLGKGGSEAAVPLPEVARVLLSEYLATERPGAKDTEPLFLVRYRAKGGGLHQQRIKSHRLWKIVKELGTRAGVPGLHPHAFRHSCGVELLRRTGGNLRAVQEHLRHVDIQTTTIYTKLMPSELQKVVSVFDQN